MTYGTTLAGAVMALALATATPAPAQEEAAAVQPPLWLVSCSNQMQPDRLVCEFSQSIVLTDEAGRSQRVGMASFARAVGAQEVTLTLALPLELALSAPPRVSVDESELGALAWQSCDMQGCYATGAVAPAWLDSLRAGKAMGVGVVARSGQAINFTFELKDFTKTEALLP